MAQLNKASFEAANNDASTGRYKAGQVDGIGSAYHRAMIVDIKDSVLFIEDHLLDEDNMASNSATQVPSQQSVKAYVDGLNHFKGLFTSLVNLQSAFPTGASGDFADVDPGSGTDLKRYAWDADEGWVVVSGGGAVSGLTSGRIPFATSGTTLGDDGNLHWDNTNKVLVLGGPPSGGMSIFADYTSNRDNLIFSDGMDDWAGVLGLDNFGVGSGALYSLYAGNHNHAIGAAAGGVLTNGEHNELIGRAAGGSLVDGSGNVIIGAYSDISASSSGNVLLGYNQQGPTTGGRHVLIGYNVESVHPTANGELSIQNAIFGTGNTAGGTSISTGNIGLYVQSPTARLHLPAGAAAAGNAPLKLTTGTALTTPEDGALEYHSSHLYFTIGSTRYQLDQQGGGGGALSALTAATGTNTINNLGHAQEWQWNSLGGATGLKLSSTSTAAASDLQTLFEANLSGANATSTQTTYAGRFVNTHTGTAATNVGIYGKASGGTNNYDVLVDKVLAFSDNTSELRVLGTRLNIYGNNITFFQGFAHYGTLTSLGGGTHVITNGSHNIVTNLTTTAPSSSKGIVYLDHLSSSLMHTSGDIRVFGNAMPIAVASGTANFYLNSVAPNYNFSGTYTGNVIGYDYDPVETSMTGTTHLAFRSTSSTAAMLLGGSTITVGSVLVDFQSTTKGVVFPRMTTTQKNALTPTAGMVIYDTTLGKLCVYTTAWETITSA